MLFGRTAVLANLKIWKPGLLRFGSGGTLFSNVHENDYNSIFVTSCPLTKKWSEFLFDVFNWRTHELFEQNYVTDLEVNRRGNGKIYASWSDYGPVQRTLQIKELDTRNLVGHPDNYPRS